MSKTPKIWTVFEAARYVDGKKQESLDARFDSSGKHRMVRLEDYQDLKDKLERQLSYWAEEANRYCGNADYWRERAEKAEIRVKELEHWFHGYKTPEESMAALEAKLAAAIQELRNIADAKPSTWTDFEPKDREEQFRPWAQNRARAAVYAATDTAKEGK